MFATFVRNLGRSRLLEQSTEESMLREQSVSAVSPFVYGEIVGNEYGAACSYAPLENGVALEEEEGQRPLDVLRT